MRCILPLAAVLLALGEHANAQCGDWYRPYPVIISPLPVPSSVWGTPAPARAIPKQLPALKEETLPRPAEREKLKKAMETPEKVIPKSPKLKPPLPESPDFDDRPQLKKEPKSGGSESFEQFIVPADEKLSKPGPQVRVGFFNHSEREIVLDVNGEQVKIPREQYVTMRLPRTFSWGQKGSKAKDVVVPPDADGIEIVFRE